MVRAGETNRTSPHIFKAGVRDGKVFSAIAALILCALVVAFALFAVRVPLNLSDSVLRRRGVAITQLPVLPPAPVSKEAEEAVFAQIDEFLRYQPSQRLDFKPLPPMEIPIELPEDLPLSGAPLKLPLPPQILPDLPSPKLSVLVTSDPPGRVEIGEEMLELDLEEWRRFAGQSAQFLVRVTSDGEIANLWDVSVTSEKVGDFTRRVLEQARAQPAEADEFVPVRFQFTLK